MSGTPTPSRKGSGAIAIDALRQQGYQAALIALTLGPALALALLWLGLTFASPYFLTTLNLTNLVAASTIVAALAVGQLMVIVTGGIDLSVGSIIALTTILGAKLSQSTGQDPWLVMATMLAIGAGIGLVNGLLIVKVRLGSPFVVTLGMLSVVSGLTFVISDGGTIIGMPSLVVQIGTGDAGGIPIAALVVLGFAGLYFFLLSLSKWGRWVFAIGGNREAARRLGIPVDATSISVYVLSGLAAGLAGVITAGMTDSGYPTAGQLSELDAIAAVIIGGASFSGGRGTVIGALLGALILTTIRNGLNLLNIDTNWAPVALGTVLILAVGLDLLRGRIETRLRLARARALAKLPDAATGPAPAPKESP